MMLLTRSSGIVVSVCSTGIVAPSGRRLRLWPGRQSMKYSPMSDCGRVSQRTSVRRSSNPPRLSSIATSARMSWRSSLKRLTLPARTPATLTSAPSVRPNALSSSTQ
jgi:hypothetical protein